MVEATSSDVDTQWSAKYQQRYAGILNNFLLPELAKSNNPKHTELLKTYLESYQTNESLNRLLREITYYEKIKAKEKLTISLLKRISAIIKQVVGRSNNKQKGTDFDIDTYIPDTVSDYLHTNLDPNDEDNKKVTKQMIDLFSQCLIDKPPKEKTKHSPLEEHIITLAKHFKQEIQILFASEAESSLVTRKKGGVAQALANTFEQHFNITRTSGYIFETPLEAIESKFSALAKNALEYIDRIERCKTQAHLYRKELAELERQKNNEVSDLDSPTKRKIKRKIDDASTPAKQPKKHSDNPTSPLSLEKTYLAKSVPTITATEQLFEIAIANQNEEAVLALVELLPDIDLKRRIKKETTAVFKKLHPIEQLALAAETSVDTIFEMYQLTDPKKYKQLKRRSLSQNGLALEAPTLLHLLTRTKPRAGQTELIERLDMLYRESIAAHFQPVDAEWNTLKSAYSEMTAASTEKKITQLFSGIRGLDDNMQRLNITMTTLSKAVNDPPSKQVKLMGTMNAKITLLGTAIKQIETLLNEQIAFSLNQLVEERNKKKAKKRKSLPNIFVAKNTSKNKIIPLVVTHSDLDVVLDSPNTTDKNKKNNTSHASKSRRAQSLNNLATLSRFDWLTENNGKKASSRYDNKNPDPESAWRDEEKATTTLNTHNTEKNTPKATIDRWEKEKIPRANLHWFIEDLSANRKLEAYALLTAQYKKQQYAAKHEEAKSVNLVASILLKTFLTELKQKKTDSHFHKKHFKQKIKVVASIRDRANKIRTNADLYKLCRELLRNKALNKRTSISNLFNQSQEITYIVTRLLVQNITPYRNKPDIETLHYDTINHANKNALNGNLQGIKNINPLPTCEQCLDDAFDERVKAKKTRDDYHTASAVFEKAIMHSQKKYLQRFSFRHDISLDNLIALLEARDKLHSGKCKDPKALVDELTKNKVLKKKQYKTFFGLGKQKTKVLLYETAKLNNNRHAYRKRAHQPTTSKLVKDAYDQAFPSPAPP
jgi:hypothetical protein